MGERISIFGYPCSGKSTVAKQIAKRLECKMIEGSSHLIFPVANKIYELPKKESEIISELKSANGRSSEISREWARKIYKKLAKQYGSDFIARALHEIYTKNTNQPVVLSGLRGYENAGYCSLHNDITVYLKTKKSILVDRLVKDRGYKKEEAENELVEEEELYKTGKIESVADLVINTSNKTVREIVKEILKYYSEKSRMCKICVNTGRNPSIKFDSEGVCNICKNYFKNFDKKYLDKEIDFLKSFIDSAKTDYDVMVGISGGKDSTATLHTLKKMGFNPLAFTFDTGYLPRSTIPRARRTAKMMNLNHEVIDIRKYLNRKDIECFRKSIELYELPFTLETKRKFKKAYDIGRKHYSIKCNHSLPFVRSCQLCRRMVIRAYYGEASKRGARAIILGINEWTNLSSAQKRGKFRVSGVRKLKPYKNKPAIYVFHLPFLLQRNSVQTKRILKILNWKAPKGEDFIESNSNSCLFARSSERMAKRLLEFHPDSTRLAREVTVGFITKKQALKALGKLHPYKDSPKEVITKAILKRYLD